MGDIRAELARIDGGKEILPDEGQQQERSRHYTCAGDEAARRCSRNVQQERVIVCTRR